MTPVLITGFHRSGTSAVARQLHASGLDLGTNLLGADPVNPYGHFEDVETIAVHDEALAAQDLTWSSLTPIDRTSPAGYELADATTHAVEQLIAQRDIDGFWGIKDPRLCLFLPEWLSVVPDAKIVVVMRRPGDVIASLHRRHSRRYVDTRHADPSDTAFWTVPDLGLRLWIHYHQQLLLALPAAANVHIVNFANRTNVETLPETLAEQWGLPFQPVSLELDDRLGALSDSAVEVRNTALIEEAQKLWHELFTTSEAQASPG